MKSRADKIKLIKTLLSMRVENGASEQEMLFVLQRAREMMDEEGIDDTDLHFGGESVTTETVTRTDFDKIRHKLATSVGFFCGCRTWTGAFDSLTYCGLASETLFAHWLLDMLAAFVEREAQTFLDRTWCHGMPRVRRIERGSFVVGCADRIAERLQQLTPKPATGNGRSLVVAKNALIKAYMDERGIKLREPFKLWRGDNAAYDAGVLAGDNAQFNRPVESDEHGRARLLR